MYRFDERGQPATHFTVAFYGLEQARFPSNFFIRREEEVIDMSITVTGRKMPVTDALRMYAEEKIGNSMKVMDINPLDAEVVLHVEKNPANATPAICEVTLRTKGHIVRVEESEEDMYAAIDVAAAKVLRQLRKFKTRVLDRKVRADAAKALLAAELRMAENKGKKSEIADAAAKAGAGKFASATPPKLIAANGKKV